MKRNILVVDDNPSVIVAVKEGLQSQSKNFCVDGVNSGSECLKMLAEEKVPDLILLDIMMPEMTGWETFDRLKEHPQWQNIPIVFLTARNDGFAKTAGKYLGEEYIEKPFDAHDLKNHIDRILSQKQQDN